MEAVIWVEMKQYVEFFHQLLNQYGADAVVTVDGKTHHGHEMEKFIKSWCNERAISKTKDFHMQYLGMDLAGFHDGPQNTWVVASEEPFLKSMAEQKIIRYQSPHKGK